MNLDSFYLSGWTSFRQTLPEQVEEQNYDLFMYDPSPRPFTADPNPNPKAWRKSHVFERDLLSGVQGTVAVHPSPRCPLRYPPPRSCRWGAVAPPAAPGCSRWGSARPRMEGPTTTTPASSPSGELCPSPLALPLQGTPGLISLSPQQLPVDAQQFLTPALSSVRAEGRADGRE